MGLRGSGLAVGLAAVVTLSGCAFAPNKSFRDDHTVPSGITAITIEGGSGSVAVSGTSTDGSIHVKRHVRYRDRKPGATDRADGGTLTLRTWCGRSCSVDYEVTAPRTVQVAGRNGSGDVDLTSVASASVAVGSGRVRVHGASGDVTVSTGSGDLDLADITGRVACRAGSGDVTLSGVTGNATAQTGSGNITGGDLRGSRTSAHTGSGDVTLTLGSAQDVDADTGSGNVRLTVPAGGTYRVAAKTSSGDSDIRVPTDPAADRQLKLETRSGNIAVAQR